MDFALIIMSSTFEVSDGATDNIYQRESSMNSGSFHENGHFFLFWPLTGCGLYYLNGCVDTFYQNKTSYICKYEPIIIYS